MLNTHENNKNANEIWKKLIKEAEQEENKKKRRNQKTKNKKIKPKRTK